MTSKTIYAIKQAINHKNQLKNILKDPFCHADNILEINPLELKERGTKVLVLDFDGVLASHGKLDISPEVLSWLDKCKDTFGEDNIYLHSNNNLKLRLQFLQTHCPYMKILTPAQKKPYPEGLISVSSQTKINFENITLIDDRLTTGMLATCLANCHGIYIEKPYINLSKHPLLESWFYLLRKIEKALILSTT